MKMIKEAIILAGGLGTRLRSVIRDIPKPMADVGNKPFLTYILDYLNSYNIKHVVLSVGYKWETIKDFFGNHYKEIYIEYAVEKELLGTGGGVKNAFRFIDNKESFILNGDTFFDIDLYRFYELHNSKSSKFSIALKKMEKADRYGSIVIDNNNRIVSFKEKGMSSNVLINGGIYVINKDFYIKLKKEAKFSLEKDVLETCYKDYQFYGFPFESFFIDIGVLEDYEKAREYFKTIQDR